MSAYRSSFRLGLLLWAVLPLHTALAQQQPQPPPKIVPGYEELFVAGQLVKSSQALDTATGSNATLLQKRQALADPPVARALDMVHVWLEKPSPPVSELDMTSEGITPALSGIRALGRALVVKQYVLLADGHVHEAIDVARDGLRLSYGIQNYNLIAWLTGRAIQVLVLRPLAAHLDELSVQDCNDLLQLARDWNSALDPMPLALERERGSLIADMHKTFAEQGSGGLSKWIQAALPEEASQNTVAQINSLSASALTDILAQVEAQINAVYRKAQVKLRTPYWERSQLPPDEEDTSLAAQLARLLIPTLGRVLDRQTEQQAMARLLGCHAAIRRYRWEQDRLPASLTELKLGDMATDPFTGQPFVYKPSGTNYQLGGVGPLARDDQDKPLPDQHVPVALPGIR